MVVLNKNKANHTPPTPQDPNFKKNKQSAISSSTPIRNSINYEHNPYSFRRSPERDRRQVTSTVSPNWSPMGESYFSSFPKMGNNLVNKTLNYENSSSLNSIMEKISNKTNDASKDASFSPSHHKSKEKLNDLSKCDDELFNEAENDSDNKEINVDENSNIDISQCNILKNNLEKSDNNFFDDTNTEYH